MIESLHIENLKGFKKYDIAFKRLNLLVGGNNSGKTTIFHALQVAFWCLEQTADLGEDVVTFRKTQVPELGAVPYFNTRDLFHNQHTRRGRYPTRITLRLSTSAVSPLSFEVYTAFSRNLMIDGGDQRIAREEYDSLRQLNPVYVPGTIGITVREDLYRTVAQERLILDGRQNQVLRNLVYRLTQEEVWKDFVETVSPLFDLESLQVPFDEQNDEWLTALYGEDGCEFDFISAGSGFLQVVNLLSFLFLHTSRVALLDEPDSHMHEDLQRVTFDLLDKLSTDRNIQLIIATHSPILVDVAGLDNVLMIDRDFEAPLQARNVETLIPLLGDRGLSLPPAKVINTLKSRKVLFVEGGEADYDEFIKRLGDVLQPGFSRRVRDLTVLETRGATKKWPFDAIEGFEALLGVAIGYVYVSDRDFLTDEDVAAREQTAQRERRKIVHLARRNRECYLLEPEVIERVCRAAWESKQGQDPYPDDLTEDGIRQFILDQARTREEETRANLLVQKESSLRSAGDRRHEATQKLLEYFRLCYAEPLSRGEIPYKLLDGKAVLAQLRATIAEKHRISFSDRDVLEGFYPEDVPEDLAALFRTLLDICSPAPGPSSPASPDSAARSLFEEA